jgi:hypothetical protein
MTMEAKIYKTTTRFWHRTLHLFQKKILSNTQNRGRWGNSDTLSIFRYAPLTYALLSESAMQIYCYSVNLLKNNIFCKLDDNNYLIRLF